MTQMLPILQEALAIHEFGGYEELLNWYKRLSPERQAEFMREMNAIMARIQSAFDAIRPALEGFALALADWSLAWVTAFSEALPEWNPK